MGECISAMLQVLMMPPGTRAPLSSGKAAECLEQEADLPPSAPSLTKGERQAPHTGSCQRISVVNLQWTAVPKLRHCLTRQEAQRHQGRDTMCPSSLVGNTAFIRCIWIDLNTTLSLDKMFQKPLNACARSFFSVHVTHHIRGCFQGPAWESPVIYLAALRHTTCRHVLLFGFKVPIDFFLCL